jgi:putative DNA methylase
LVSEAAPEVAYRLDAICQRKKWADDAPAYNSLVMAWPELLKLVPASRNRPSAAGAELF